MEIPMSSIVRRRTAPSLWHTLVGLTFATAGIAKLTAVEPEAKLFRSWGWTKSDMQIIGASELLGAALLVTHSTQRVGALLLSSSSVCILSAELRHGDDLLVTPRSAMLIAALTGFIRRR
jgi:uncharacterized membrane protein